MGWCCGGLAGTGGSRSEFLSRKSRSSGDQAAHLVKFRITSYNVCYTKLLRNKADQASIRIENSKIRGSVVNSSSIQQSANLAVGTGNTASQAAVVVGGVQLNGMVVNNAAASDSVNAAMGVGNEAHQSSIVVDDVLGSRQFTGA